ncbi:MAG: hypothetical protein Q7R94_01490 [bacterium]|nr:hypothetical protein [bacterium]
MNKEEMTIEALAEITQKEFLAIRTEMATKTDLAALSGELRSEMGELERELKSEIVSSRDYVVDEIKTFMQPHIKSLDAVLVDVENLKSRIKN